MVFLIIMIVLLVGGVGALAYWNYKQSLQILDLEYRLNMLSRGSDGDSLEQALLRILDNHDALVETTERNSQDIEELYAKLRPVLQKVGVVKYDAFRQMGGNLSSAIAILDEEDNGFIINTVQNVDGCYSYVKEVFRGGADGSLGEEEERALAQARENYNRIVGRS